MFTESQIKFSNKKETDPSDFEDLVQTFLNFYRMSKTRFFVKHGIAYLSENGVVNTANLRLHQLRTEISFNPSDVNKAKFEALRRFIDEEESKSAAVEDENKKLEGLSFDEKLDRLSENKLIERTILFWRDRSTISLQEIRDNSEECIEQIVLGQLYKAELSKIFPNFIANYSSVLATVLKAKRPRGSAFPTPQELEDNQLLFDFQKALLTSFVNRVDLELFQSDSSQMFSYYTVLKPTAEQIFLRNLKNPSSDPILVKKMERGEFAQDVIVNEAMEEVGGSYYLRSFFDTIIKNFNPYFREDENVSRALENYEPDTKQKCFESIWQEIRTAEAGSRVDLLKKFISHEGSEYVLFHLFELNISSTEEKEIILHIAERDPEALLQSAGQLDLDEWRDELFAIFAVKAPVEFLSKARELNLGEHELEQAIDRFIEETPLTFLETYPQLFAKNYFSGTKKKEWTEKLNQYLDKLTEPETVLIALGSIDVYKDFPELQEKIDRKVRNAIKLLGHELYQILVETEEKGNNSVGARLGLLAEARKNIAAWGCLDYYHDLIAYVDYLNLTLNPVGQEKLAGFYVEDAYAKTKRNSRFGLLEQVLDKLKRGEKLVMGWEELLMRTENKLDEKLLEELFETLLKDASADNLFSLIKVTRCLSLTKAEKEARYKKIIDVSPVELVGFYLADLFNDFSDEVRLYFIEVLLATNPHALGEHYSKIALRDKQTEERVFKKILKDGVFPFAQFKDVNILLPILRTPALSFFWTDGSNARFSEAKNNILEARKFLSAKTWNFLLTMARENEGSFIESFFQQLSVENYKILDEIISAEDEIFQYIFEFSEGKKLKDSERLLVVPFMRSGKLADWKKKISELRKINAANKRPVADELQLLLAVENGISIKEATALLEPFKSFFHLRILNPRISARSQFKFIFDNNERLDAFFSGSVVASDKSRILELILNSDNPARKLEFLEKMANDLDSPVALWTQLAIMSKTLLLEEMSQHVFVRESIPFAPNSDLWLGISEEERTRLLAEGERKGSLTWISGTKFSPEQIRCLVENRLKKTFELSRDNLASATQRNREFADSQLDGLILPLGTLLHFSDDTSAGEVLRLGNLCGECLGIKSDRDSFPYHVDTLRVQENITERDIVSVLNSRLNYNGEILYLYPFRNEASAANYQEEFPVDSGHLNHHLIFGALQRTELGGIVLKDSRKRTAEEKASLIENLKLDIVKNDIYIPIFDTKGRLLFTYEEFEAQWKELKPVSSVEKFLATDSLLDHLDFSGGGGHRFTVKEHSLRVEEKVMAAAERKNLPQRLQTIMRVAARLHDSGKKREGIEVQEISNVESAREMLDQIRFLQLEDRRLILKFIRNDELLGEILKEMKFESGKWHLDKAGRDKLKKFKEIFADEKERTAIIILYEADVKSIGGEEYNQWMVEEKLKELGFI